MKSSCIFLMCLCVSSLFMGGMTQSDLTADVQSLLQMQTMANDAIDTVLNLLMDLKNANIKEQQEADALNKTQEAEGLALIANLTAVRDENRKILDNAIEHTKYVEQEINDTKNYLEWIVQRRNTITKRLADLSDQRCYQNMMFVKSLKEHKDALDVIALLIQDLQPYASKKVAFNQINDITQKLQMYSHLFNEQAMNDFLQLSSDRAAYEDNARKQLKLGNLTSGTDTRDLKAKLGDNIIDLLEKLRKHLDLSMKDLETQEIQAAYDFAEYQQKSERENATLNAEEERKQKYLAKLNVDLPVAVQYQAKAQKEWQDSVNALKAAIDDLNAKRAYYAKETKRRNAENAVLDEVIAIFKEKVASVKQYLRGRVEDYNTDKKFDKTDLKSREIDQQIATDQGKLAANVKAESVAKY